MITCDKCGFGHKTFEEKRACKSWDEIAAELKALPAATQEPAGSGAKLKPQPYNSEQEVGKSGVGPSVGSPRKVGEDGALTEERAKMIAACLVRGCIVKLGHERTREGVIDEIASTLLTLARSSSVPVGEQKQEEGV